MKPLHILINLPAGFFSQPELNPVFDRLSQWGTLRKTSHNTLEEIRGDLQWAEVVIMWAWPVIDEETLEKCPQLRFIGFLDVGQAMARTLLKKGIPISNSRGGFSPAVAEMALGLTLSLLRKISDFHSQMRLGNEPWVARFPEDIDPTERELTGRSVGIIGFGGVGRRLAELLAPFRCELRVVDPYVPQEILDKAGAKRVELAELIRNSEITIVCAASNPGSKKMIGADEIALLRPNALFINVARSALVDMPALIQRLEKKDLFAALDVFDQEPLPPNDPLRKIPNLYLTPHRAGGLISSVERIMEWLANDLQAVLEDKPRRYALTEKMISSLDGK